MTQYSQKPPPKSVNTSAEADVSQHANIMKPEKRGKDYYCCDYRLSKVQGTPARIITRLQENLINWQREKDQQYERRLNVTKKMNEAINRQLDQRIRNNGRNYSSSYTDRHKKSYADTTVPLHKSTVRLNGIRRNSKSMPMKKRLLLQSMSLQKICSTTCKNKKPQPVA